MSAGLVAALAQASGAQAQVRPYLVLEGGLERRQVLPDGGSQITVDNPVDEAEREEGFAYSFAVGAETPLSAMLFAGVEASVTKSTADTEAVQFRGVEIEPGVLIGIFDRTEVHPRWSYAVTGRLGFSLSRSAAIYGLLGVGGERARVDLSNALEIIEGVTSDTAELRTTRSYDGAAFGGGARLFLSDRVGARLEYRRIETDDGFDPEKLMAGLIYRF